MHRAGFRFAFVFLLLSSGPDLLFAFPGGPTVVRMINSFWRALVPWVGKHVLQLPEMTAFGGGDTAFAYVKVLTTALLALGAALVWTLADRRATHYRTLHYWLRVLVRYALAYSVLIYGTVKLFQVQFPTPILTRLIEPFGNLSPHGLLWNFMGFSRTYQVFSGGVECVGARKQHSSTRAIPVNVTVAPPRALVRSPSGSPSR